MAPSLSILGPLGIRFGYCCIMLALISIYMITIWVAVTHVQPDILSHGLATKFQLQVWDLITRWSHENGTGMGWIGLGVVPQIPPKDCRKIPFYKCSCFLWSDRYISVGQPEKQHTQMTTNRSNVGSSGFWLCFVSQTNRLDLFVELCWTW